MRNRAVCSIAMFLLFMLSLSTMAFAIETRSDSRMEMYYANLRKSDGNLIVYFFVEADNTMEVLGASKIVIQQNSGPGWVTECTLTVKNTPEIQTSNAARHSASIHYEPDYSNADYRAVVTFYAKDNYGSSTLQVITM